MLDPNALGTAFDIHWQLVHSVTFIEHFSGPQGRRRCLAAGVLDIWHGTDPPDLGTARHGTSLDFGVWEIRETICNCHVFYDLVTLFRYVFSAIGTHASLTDLFTQSHTMQYSRNAVGNWMHCVLVRSLYWIQHWLDGDCSNIF